jgi:glycosyltransferase involved in cell wall biosynthesis
LDKKNNNMRMVIDLQAAQTEASRNRGVGRYSQSLATHIAQLKGEGDLRFTCNSNYQDPYRDIINVLGPYVPRQNISDYRYPTVRREYAGERNASAQVAEVLIRQHWSSLQPDVLHVSHIFEGLVGEAVVPHRLPKMSGLLRSATLYDLIPLRFQEQYLSDPRFKRWYMEKLGTLRECDLLLAISESSRKDAIELLGIEPSRVVTIWGGVDSHFVPQEMREDDVAAFRNKFNLRARFVLYTGGDDHRKNIEGAIAGFSLVPRELRRDTQLVIICTMQPERQAMYLKQAQSYGLAQDDVVFTGFVAEDDLVTFYNLCDAFVFPSLYEGFGLPVLEAMACGAPVLGGNNSSIREIIGRDDALFDAQRPDSIGQAISNVLCDQNFTNNLRRYGTQRAKEFNWERSAQLALDAFQEAHDKLLPNKLLSVANGLPRKKLAFFTPLPPCRSGIADYNAIFLPFLARYFDIDLFIDDYEVSDAFIKANFKIRSHQTYPKLADQYDAVMYELGNSEFHAYMFNYLERHPGIVGLHDAYLSGLYGYLAFNSSQPRNYYGEMLHAHGTRARRYFAPIQNIQEPVGMSMMNLPCTKGVIESATGVISHSPFNLEVARNNYPEGWAAPYRVIKQMVKIPAASFKDSENSYRAELGFNENDFIVCTFGHIIWMKCGDLLLSAFLQSSFARNPKAKLVFVGELAKDDFGENLEKTIKQSEFSDQIRITGYLNEADYAKYLVVANLAVQLRKNSRGGTPKGVLDCLAHRVPVIVNNDASYTDYPGNVVLKLSPNPGAEELSAEFNRLYEAPSRLADVAAAAHSYMFQEHHPETVAAQYSLAINEFIERSKENSLQYRVKEMAAIVADAGDSKFDIKESAAALYVSLSRSLFKQQRILIDVSHLANSDHGTGIQRVVRNIVRWFYTSERAGFQPLAVRLVEDVLVEANDWLVAEGLVHPSEHNDSAATQKINVMQGDILLMLDSSWGEIDKFLPIFENIRRLNGKIYTVIYDVIPISHPQYFVSGGATWFKNWLEKAVDNSDGLICISRAVADEVNLFIRAGAKTETRPIRIGYWHLGGDFAKVSEAKTALSSRIEKAMLSKPFLMVGTIEPRKGHALALDAMEALWKRGCDIGLCIAGKKGWMVDELMERIVHHPELGKKLHFIDQPTDEELHYAYRHSSVLLFPSAGEGFGLPVIEAAQFGTPIIASDIPVLREIAGEHATYFSLGSVDSLVCCMEEWLIKAKSGDIPASRDIEWLTWEQSAEQLLSVILDNRWYKSSLEY